MYGQMSHTLKAFIIIKTTFYLLNNDKRTNKTHFYRHICICEACFLASQ